MPHSTLSPDIAQRLEELKGTGHRIIGPGPVTPGETPPTPDSRVGGAGMHLQIADPSGRLIEGFGGTADEAARDALAKLGGVGPQNRTFAT